MIYFGSLHHVDYTGSKAQNELVTNKVRHDMTRYFMALIAISGF